MILLHLETHCKAKKSGVWSCSENILRHSLVGKYVIKAKIREYSLDEKYVIKAKIDGDTPLGSSLSPGHALGGIQQGG